MPGWCRASNLPRGSFFTPPRLEPSDAIAISFVVTSVPASFVPSPSTLDQHCGGDNMSNSTYPVTLPGREEG